eukprot:1098403-Prymnesium_polylepis.1
MAAGDPGYDSSAHRALERRTSRSGAGQPEHQPRRIDPAFPREPARLRRLHNGLWQGPDRQHWRGERREILPLLLRHPFCSHHWTLSQVTYPHELQYRIGRAADVPDDLQRAFKTAPRHLFIVPHIQERSELTKEGFDPKFANQSVAATKLFTKLGLRAAQVKDSARHTYIMAEGAFSRAQFDDSRVVVTTAQKAAQEIVNGNIKERPRPRTRTRTRPRTHPHPR